MATAENRGKSPSLAGLSGGGLTLHANRRLLIQNDFPLYSVIFDDIRGLIIVGGGGGPSKSGIANGIVLGECNFKIVYRLIASTSKPNSRWHVRKTLFLSTESEAVMCMSLHRQTVSSLFAF